MNLNELTIEQLQALAFRMIRDIENIQNQKLQVLDMLNKKESELLQKKQ